MLLIPAIDLKDGHCVRLKQGDMEQATVFSDDPAQMARHWLEQGARRLHLVDLNGAFAGTPKNASAVKSIIRMVQDFAEENEVGRSSRRNNMGSMSIWHWLIVLLVIVLVFGTKKLGNIGSDLGKAVKGFKDGVKGGEEDKAAAPTAQVADKSTIDVEAREKNKV